MDPSIIFGENADSKLPIHLEESSMDSSFIFGGTSEKNAIEEFFRTKVCNRGRWPFFAKRSLISFNGPTFLVIL
jgi:hypothetical protein